MVDSNIIRESWEDDDVVEDWDADEDEDNSTSLPPPPPLQKTIPQPKTQKAVVEEKKVASVDPYANETSAQRKARIERVQQQADLDSACSLFKMDNLSLGDDDNSSNITSSNTASNSPAGEFYSSEPGNLNEFLALSAHITKRLETFQSQKSYLPFVENLVVSLLGKMELVEIRKVSSSITEVISQKQKERIALTKSAKKAIPSLKFNKQRDNVYDDLFPSADDDPFA